ncbi:LexA family transcriptional regulator [Enterococcus casseliflavus]|uniref:LexA family protein n=1 Tax=Enterococcus casseliflavus TaxID=37734 RepID=UPI001AD719D7|nr:LexA family transcriptional regulator [Enterococcus casseliflavus]MDT2984740.1 LexA family transcriptional regulator [Enterococcus casseliflavus]
MATFNLKKRREELNLSQESVAESIGVTKATVSKWEKGDIANMKRDKIALLAKVLKVSPLSILGLEDVSDSDRVMIPILGTIMCGEPILAEENIEGYREEIADFLPSGELFFLKTKGDSMVPTVPEKSYVLLRRQEDVEDGEIAAVIINGDNEATLKRVKRQNGIVMLIADNKDYSPILITPENPARIIGKAVKVSFDL